LIEAYIIFTLLTGVTIPGCEQDIQPTVIILAPDGRLVEVPTAKPECNEPDDGIEEASYLARTRIWLAKAS